MWGIVLTLACYLTTGMATIYCLLALGFSAAMLWGTIWGLAIRGLGRHTKRGAALLIMSIIGGGLFPVAFGSLLDANAIHPQNAILLLLPCYGYLLYYATKGHQLLHWKQPAKMESRPERVKAPTV